MWRLGLLAALGCNVLVAGADPRPAALPPGVLIGPKHRDDGPGTPPPFHMAVSAAPVDPWVGVAGDRPVRFPDDTGMNRRWELSENRATCTAAHDHCLPAIAWLFVPAGRRTQTIQRANVAAFTPEGPTTPRGLEGPNKQEEIGGDPYIAYRTVPATRKNLAVGALVATFPYPNAIPADNRAAHNEWLIGKVERVDWDLGMVFLETSRDPAFLTATRVVVLAYERGGKVAIVGGKARDQLAVAPADLILPP